ncbi:MAG: amino acid dehydrogenase [Streptosporangiales bacterium]|nr:amino acid dehydrogenase [Streptosporangiales bacterium]
MPAAPGRAGPGRRPWGTDPAHRRTDPRRHGGAAMSSSALRGRERLRPERPAWAAASEPLVRRPLPLVTREAVARPVTGATNARLVQRNMNWNADKWPPAMAELRERGAAIRRETLRDLEGYLRRLTERVEEHGGRVHRATTPDDARRIVGEIARDGDVRLAIKSKSMVSEEIELGPYLEEHGVEVVETDLGEYIVQLADERPGHIIAPAIHKSRADIHDLFERLGGERLPDAPEQLAAFARRRLRDDFHGADMGISGVNFACADTGTLVTVTNEGNARMVTSQPRIHVAVMTLEKVIPRFTDLGVLVPLLSHAATRQRVSVYQTMVTGPRRPGEADGPEELHLIILDNGRSRIPGTQYEEVLACIRCGACQVACPVFRTVGGGHAYNAVYGGPIGAVLTPLIGDQEEGADLPFLSSLCGACYDACPVKIPLPDMLVDLRADYERRHRGPARVGWAAWSRLWGSPLGYRASLLGGRLAGLLPGGLVGRTASLARSWSRGRDVPPLRAAGAFRRWFRSHRGEPG